MLCKGVDGGMSLEAKEEESLPWRNCCCFDSADERVLFEEDVRSTERLLIEEGCCDG